VHKKTEQDRFSDSRTARLDYSSHLQVFAACASSVCTSFMWSTLWLLAAGVTATLELKTLQKAVTDLTPTAAGCQEVQRIHEKLREITESYEGKRTRARTKLTHLYARVQNMNEACINMIKAKKSAADLFASEENFVQLALDAAAVQREIEKNEKAVSELIRYADESVKGFLEFLLGEIQQSRSDVVGLVQRLQPHDEIRIQPEERVLPVSELALWLAVAVAVFLVYPNF
jgi:hypothetical protein